jgi:mitogen-activated protein kinase kinase kinase
MIAVKQVEMPRTDRDREDTRQTGMIEALKSEIALLKDLDHPNVVTYLGEWGHVSAASMARRA